MTPFNHWVAYFQYHLKCQNSTDNRGDNELHMILSIHEIVYASQIVHLDEKEPDFDLI